MVDAPVLVEPESSLRAKERYERRALAGVQKGLARRAFLHLAAAKILLRTLANLHDSCAGKPGQVIRAAPDSILECYTYLASLIACC